MTEPHYHRRQMGPNTKKYVDAAKAGNTFASSRKRSTVLRTVTEKEQLIATQLREIYVDQLPWKSVSKPSSPILPKSKLQCPQLNLQKPTSPVNPPVVPQLPLENDMELDILSCPNDQQPKAKRSKSQLPMPCDIPSFQRKDEGPGTSHASINLAKTTQKITKHQQPSRPNPKNQINFRERESPFLIPESVVKCNEQLKKVLQATFRPPWILRGVCGVGCSFEAVSNYLLRTDDIIQGLNSKLSIFNVYLEKDIHTSVYIVQVKKVADKNSYRLVVNIRDIDGLTFGRNSFMEMASDLGIFLLPFLKSKDTLIIVGGSFDIPRNTLKVGFAELNSGRQTLSQIYQFFNLSEGTNLESFAPFAKPLPSNLYQMQMRQAANWKLFSVTRVVPLSVMKIFQTSSVSRPQTTEPSVVFDSNVDLEFEAVHTISSQRAPETSHPASSKITSAISSPVSSKLTPEGNKPAVNNQSGCLPPLPDFPRDEIMENCHDDEVDDDIEFVDFIGPNSANPVRRGSIQSSKMESEAAMLQSSPKSSASNLERHSSRNKSADLSDTEDIIETEMFPENVSGNRRRTSQSTIASITRSPVVSPNTSPTRFSEFQTPASFSFDISSLLPECPSEPDLEQNFSSNSSGASCESFKTAKSAFH